MSSVSENNVVIDIDEEVWVVLLDEPAEHLHKAHESVLKREFQAAAAEIEKVAAFCRIEASRAAQGTRDGLVAAGHELEKLAGDMRSGTVEAVQSVKAAFARAHHALAKHHCLKATEAWTKKEVQKTGHALRAATFYIERGFDAAGHEIEKLARRTLDGSRHIAETMLGKDGKFGENVGSAIKDCGKQTELLGETISK